MGWLSDLFKAGPVYKHWWRENHDSSYRIIASIYGDGDSVDHREVAVVTFNSTLPVDVQHSALARIIKGLNNG